MFRNSGERLGKGNSLPRMWLNALPSPPTARAAAVAMKGCIPPPSRPDLPQHATTEEELLCAAIAVEEEMEENPPSSDIPKVSAEIVALYSLDSRLYKLANAWGSHPGRSVDAMGPVAPFFRCFLEGLYRLPQRMQYCGPAVRVMKVGAVPSLIESFDSYDKTFAKGTELSFYSFASFGIDEKKLEAFTGSVSERIIVLTCRELQGYHIDELSMIPRSGGDVETEVLVPCPSFFRVSDVPRRLHKVVFVAIELDTNKTAKAAYFRPNMQLPPIPKVTNTETTVLSCR